MNFTFEQILHWMNTPIVHLGGTPLTVSGMGTALVIFLAFVFGAKVLCKIIEANIQKRFKIEAGITYAIVRIVNYSIISVGFIIATQSVGLNFGSLAVVFGFMSVGIGFGLQNVTSNFISGLILLIERPVSVGDFVLVGGETGVVKNISMRSAKIMTLDNVTIIVPNSKFIEDMVTNWTVDDPRVRIHCTVGVAYGADLKVVKESLLSCAKAHDKVLDHPEPEVRFLAFGDSSLDFDLLVWIRQPKDRDRVTSDLNFAIDEAFRKAGVEIPFPQRDLNLRMNSTLQKVLEVSRSCADG